MTHILSVYQAAATAAEKKTPLLNGRYELTGRTLGDGTSGTVFEAIDHGNHEQRIAIKICETGGRISEYLEKLRREAVVGAGIPHHPNVCKTFDSFLIGSKFYIVMELVEGESFDIYICKKKTRFALETQKFFLAILYQMASAIAHLHDNSIVHCDIKPMNFVVSQNPDGTPRAVLIDFGFSTRFDEVEKVMIGTPYFMSPQVAKCSGIDEKCDMWAFGILILLVLTKEEVPLYLKSTNDSCQAIVDLLQNLKENPFPVRFTKDKDPMIALFANIARRCLEIEPSMRPSAAEIAKDLLAFKAQ